MPKIIPDLKKRILDAARERIKAGEEIGFSMRSIAAECGISPGSIYNYHKDKVSLIAAVMMDDWGRTLEQMNLSARTAVSFAKGMEELRITLQNFIGRYRKVWHTFDNGAGTVESQNSRHREMMAEIRKPVTALLGRFGKAEDERIAGLLGEMVLSAALHSDISPRELELLCGYIVKESKK